jgi:hypothetical protein
MLTNTNKTVPVFFSFYAVLFFLIITNCSFPQNNDTAFSKIMLGANLQYKSNNDFLNKYWTPHKGIELYAATPFYFGSITAGASIVSFSSLNSKKPDYTAKLFFVSWGNKLNLPFNTSFSAGIKAGNYTFSFADDTINSNLQTESELAAGLFALFSLNKLYGFSLNISADFLKVFTNRRITLIFLSAGISYSVNSPIWFRKIFD